MVYLQVDKIIKMDTLVRFRLIFFIYIFLLSDCADAQKCISKSQLDMFIADYIQKAELSGYNDVVVLVLSCSKEDTIEFSLTHNSSAEFFKYVNANRYYLNNNNNYVLVRLNRCNNTTCIDSLPFHKLDDYNNKQIFSLLIPPGVLVDGDYPTVIYKFTNGQYDSTWYNSSNDIPVELLYLDQIDNEYILNLNFEQVRKSTEVTNQISINTRITEFSFYYSENNKSIFCFSGTNGKSYKFPKQFDNNADFSDLGFDFQINDSIVKKPNSDTIFIIRGNDNFNFVFPK